MDAAWRTSVETFLPATLATAVILIIAHLERELIQKTADSACHHLRRVHDEAVLSFNRLVARMGHSLKQLWDQQRPVFVADELAAAFAGALILIPALILNMVILYFGLELVLPENYPIIDDPVAQVSSQAGANTTAPGQVFASNEAVNESLGSSETFDWIDEKIEKFSVLFRRLHRHASLAGAVGLSLIEGLLGILLFRRMRPEEMAKLRIRALWQERSLWTLVFFALVLTETVLSAFRTYFYAIDYTDSFLVLTPMCIVGGTLGFVAPWGIAATLHLVASTSFEIAMLVGGCIAVVLTGSIALLYFGAKAIGCTLLRFVIQVFAFLVAAASPIVDGVLTLFRFIFGGLFR